MKLPKILPAPSLPSGLDTSAQWLAGEGAGSWFVTRETDQEGEYTIKRYDPNGILECEGLFEADKPFDIAQPFVIDYPSHCAVVTALQKHTQITFRCI